MNAQETWKSKYIKFMSYRSKNSKRVERGNMKRFRREAALERKVEMLERENDRLKELLQQANSDAWHDRM